MASNTTPGTPEQAIAQALTRLPHDLQLRGMGHDVDHNPAYCYRCVAEAALRELVKKADGDV